MNITIYTYRWNSKQKHYDIIPLKGGEAVDSAKTKFNAELKLKFLHEQQEIRRLEGQTSYPEENIQDVRGSKASRYGNTQRHLRKRKNDATI